MDAAHDSAAHIERPLDDAGTARETTRKPGRFGQRGKWQT
jgi:hypothetical protein